MKRAVFILSILALVALFLMVGLGGLAYLLWSRSGPPVAGVWKATDQFGHEHYFHFHEDGTFKMWDRDRTEGGGFETRGPFGGRYHYLERRTIQVSTGWNGYQAKLDFLADDELKHDFGFGMRSGLTFKKQAR